MNKINWLVVAFLLAGFFLATEVKAQPSEIAEIRCIIDRPMLAVRPIDPKKQPVLMRWVGNRWLWTWASASDWEEVPADVFRSANGWWIERKQPKFGHNEGSFFGLVSTVSSWRWVDNKWQGTGTPPTATLPP